MAIEDLASIKQQFKSRRLQMQLGHRRQQNTLFHFRCRRCKKRPHAVIAPKFEATKKLVTDASHIPHSFFRFTCPDFRRLCQNLGHSMLQLEPLGQKLLLRLSD